MLQTGIKAGFDPEMQRINRKHCLTNKNNQVMGEDELNIDDVTSGFSRCRGYVCEVGGDGLGGRALVIAGSRSMLYHRDNSHTRNYCTQAPLTRQVNDRTANGRMHFLTA